MESYRAILAVLVRLVLLLLLVAIALSIGKWIIREVM